jgi:5-hydroxyisourate hydrolase
MMITTHVQDSARGLPAVRIPVELDIFVATEGWREVGHGITNMDGYILDFGEYPAPGIYRLMFDIATYIPDAFFPSIAITFEVRDQNAPHHIPLVLSPFGYSTYRSSKA